MTNTEALQSLINDVSTSLAGMQQDISSTFVDPDWERAQLLHTEVRELFAEGAYQEAATACETLIELLEEVEMKYMFWLEKNDISSIHEHMHHDLELVQTAPEQIVDDRVEELETYKHRIHKLTISPDTLMYRIVYHNLLRLEVVLLLVMMTTFIFMLFSIFQRTPSMWYLLTFLAVLGLGIWVLRMMRHSWGVIIVILLCIGGFLWHAYG